MPGGSGVDSHVDQAHAGWRAVAALSAVGESATVAGVSIAVGTIGSGAGGPIARVAALPAGHGRQRRGIDQRRCDVCSGEVDRLGELENLLVREGGVCWDGVGVGIVGAAGVDGGRAGADLISGWQLPQ